MALNNRKNVGEYFVFFILMMAFVGLLSGCNPIDLPNEPDEPVDDPGLQEPDEPTEPEDPVIPTEPQEPAEPDESTKPIEPQEPAKPTEPKPQPTEPIQYLRAFYVSNSGDDSNDGLSPEKPLKTIKKVNSLKLKPGDAILFKRGDKWVNENLLIPYSGTAENRITYSAYGEGDKPIITGIHEVPGWKTTGNWNNLGSNAWSIRLGGATGRRFWINGEEVERSPEDILGAGAVSKDYPWQFWGGILYVYSVGNPANYYDKIEISSGSKFLSDPRLIDYITLSHLDIRGWRFANLHGCSHWIIEYCNWGWGNPEYGIRIYGEGNTVSESGIIRYCTFDSGDRFSETRNPSKYMYSLNTHSAVYIRSNVKNWHVHDNKFLAWGHTAVSVGSTDGVSEGNKVYNNYFSQEWGSYGRALGARGTRLKDFNENNPNEIFNNYVYEQNVRSQFQQPYLKVYNNIFDRTDGSTRNKGGDIDPQAVGQSLNIEAFSGGIPYKMKFYNNVFAYAIGEGVAFHMWDYHINSADEIEFVNNIFYNNQRRHLSASDNNKIKNPVFKNNLFYADKQNIIRIYKKNMNVESFNALAKDSVNNPQNWITSGNLNIDPMFVDPENGDFRLRAGSPAIGAGINVGLTHDYAGKPYKSTPSIGPFEYYP